MAAFGFKPRTRETRENASIERFVERLQRSAKTTKSVTSMRRIEAREAVHGEWPDWIDSGLRDAMAARGVERPYSHQAAAWDSVGQGRDTVVVTPTASGKTLCYNAPIVSMLAGDEAGCALYLYPTKALAQDQCAELNALLDAAGVSEEARVYDGDTPADIRRRVRQSGRAILSNPDMLHAAILPHHEKWRRLFASLRYVVVDEMHMYRGVFGSHVANIFRRLQRICAIHGSDPVFVFTSATIANPGELAGSLVGRPVTAITDNGAPAGEKLFVMYNPPIMDRDKKLRQSPGGAAHRMVTRLLRKEHATIVFVRSRKGVEILTRRLKETFESKRDRRLAGRITGYRGGYLPNERRRIEKSLREGEILGVVSTNALELGIDIGGLDACILAGYPGSIASTWQRAGRAGRRQRTALTVLIAADQPVDQYIVNNPDYFFGASPEHARIDANNLRILAEHLKCAVYESSIRTSEHFGDFSVSDTQEVLEWLAEETGLIQLSRDAWHWSNRDDYPATTVNIRDIADENFVIIDTTRKKSKILGEIDFVAAHKTVHQNAIYQHDARLYEVHKLDYNERKAYVRSADAVYFTQAIDQTRVFVLDEFEEQREGSTGRGWGEVRVATRFVGYKKIRFKTFENIGYGEIALPDLERHSTSYWVTFPSTALSEVDFDGTSIQGAIQGIGNVLHTLAIVHVMCDANDLLITLGSRDGAAWNRADPSGDELPVPLSEGGLLEDPTVFLYDRYPGGVGFSEKLYDLHDTLLTRALELIEACPCESGCPSCVGPAQDVTEHGKAAAVAILRRVNP